MPPKQQIHLYCLCWNDARMLPYFFRHYDCLVDRYFVFDNGSRDGSLALLEAHDKVTVEHFEVPGDSFVEEERRLSDTVWQQSRGKADWVIVLDIDEHVYRPDLAAYLCRCTDSNITALRAIGYEMVSDVFPLGEQPLAESVTLGLRSAGHDKLCIFNPDAVTHSGFGPGRHTAKPEGDVCWPARPEMLLLHYKQLGVDYAIRRSAELRLGLGQGDLEQGWGRQYLWGTAEIARRWSQLREVARPVPGLGTLSCIDPADYDEEQVIAESGLFDTAWYLATYPDVAAAGMNALSHFCIHGWREGRKPNFYFDPRGYLQSNPGVREAGGNPLVHYIRDGERLGARPSPHFEPQWYRGLHELDDLESPLRHYLLHRAGGRVSPLPDFDVLEYCRENPRSAGSPWDPFEEHWNRVSAQAAGESAVSTFPPFHVVAARLGGDPRRNDGTITVELSTVLQLLKLFVSAVVVDEVRYRRAYPDVAQAIEEGTIPSARSHFIESGYFEGRSPCPEGVS